MPVEQCSSNVWHWQLAASGMGGDRRVLPALLLQRIDQPARGLIQPEVLEKQGRAYAFVIDELMKYNKADLERDATPYTAEKSIYQSDILKLLLGNH